MSWFMTDERRRRAACTLSRVLIETFEQSRTRITLEDLTRNELETPGESNKKKGD